MMKKGSALLVVLGMLAFMVISAVAFSAWMRSGRLPNSYLRRASASRLLAKAALAAAIDDIDVAIGDNLHPGFGTHKYSFRDVDRVRGTGKSANRNIWAGRVFIGQKVELDGGGTKNYTDSDDVREHLISPSKTVSTLTLEGLAYIPPPFVTEARYYSRRSSAATWHDLAFDAGRYAFSAIDVSDCFDVNTLAANVGRSTTPYGRISLAYLFESGGHKLANNIHAQSWDDFMKEFFRKKSMAEQEVDNGEASGEDIVDSTKVPITSVADLNLAMYAKGGATGVGNLPSLFSKYVETGASSFYGGVTPTGEDGQRIRGMAFVADSWFPSTASYSTSAGGSTVSEIDLADKANQPFLDGLQENNKKTAVSITEGYSKCALRLHSGSGSGALPHLGLILLHDYLDADNVPVSLSLPQVERSPMIAGIKHEMGDVDSSLTVKFNVEEGTNFQDDGYKGVDRLYEDNTKRDIRKTCVYKLDPAGLLAGIERGFKAVVVYPFRHGKDLVKVPTYTYEAHVEMFLTIGDMKLRVPITSLIRPSGDITFGVSGVWQESIIHMIMKSGTSPDFSNVTDESSAVKSVSFALDDQQISEIVKYLNNEPFLRVVWKGTQSRTKDDEGNLGPWQAPVWNEERFSVECKLCPLDGSGNKVDMPALLKTADEKSLTLRTAVWIRVLEENNTLDIVPGHVYDDYEYNGIGNKNSSLDLTELARCGKDLPLMLFSGNASLKFKNETVFDAGASINCQLLPKGVMCADPRWNWAPEHWFQNDTVDENNWKMACQVGQNGRDRDIFMMSGDAGYMQSVYELACLPRLSGLDNWGRDETLGNMDDLNSAAYATFATDFTGTKNNHLAWMTYNPYYRKDVAGFDTHPKYGDCRRDPFGDLNIVNRGSGFKICPFSDSTNVVLAAFANTPTDWWAAGIDPDGNAGVPDSDRKAARVFNEKYAFNEYNTKAMFAWKDIEKIAGNFVSAMHDANLTQESLDDGIDAIWQNAYDENLNWSGDVGPNQGDWHNLFGTLTTAISSGNSDLDDITDDLYDVDRKFLYGYWRECFAARQQLFLVFVRAEPAMMGGGAVGAVPPQLAARAVALVWRDPNPTPGHADDIKYPHKTRVLFYRQLD